MFMHRVLVTLGVAAVAMAVPAFFIASTPTYAAQRVGGTNDTTVQLAPPLQAPTLAPRTPDFGGLPPIDLGELGSKPTATPTPSASDAGSTEVVVENTYDECDKYEDEAIVFECVNGNLAFTRKDTEGTRWIYYNPVLEDAEIEVTARLPSQENARYGVVFRLDDTGDNFYVLGVTNEGQYGLFRFAGDHYETIIPYTDSFYVGNASFPSKIRIVNQGDTIAFSIGGQWIDSIRDPNLKSGKVALFFEPDKPGQTVLFDDLKISKINSPLEVPEPRVVEPAPTPTAEGGNAPIFDFPTATPQTGPQPTQTPYIIIVTATPEPAVVQPTAAPTRAPTRRPTAAADECPAGGNEAWFYLSNNYTGLMMRFTIGGGDWGTHDYDIPGDGKYYIIKMPPGKYTYTASIPGKGQAHGERKDYEAGQCYSLRFSP